MDNRVRHGGGVGAIGATGESAYKPDPVVLAEASPGDHLSAITVTDDLVRSTRELGRAALKRSRRCRVRRPDPILTLLLVGFT